MAELRGMKIHTKGDVLVVSLEDKSLLGPTAFLAEAMDHITEVVEARRSKCLLLDLTDITSISSEILGSLVGLKHRGVQIRLFNITPDVRFVLETTSLVQLFELREGDLSTLIDEATEE